MSPNGPAGESLHLPFMAYQVGFASAWYEVEAMTQWQVADGERPVPTHLTNLAGAITNSADHLVRSVEGRRRAAAARRAGAIHRALDQARRIYSVEWNGPAHQQCIRRRDKSDSEYYHHRLMIEGQKVFLSPSWGELPNATREFVLGLPIDLGRWCTLGQAIAWVLDGLTERGGEDLIPRLRNLLSEMREAVHGLSITFWPGADPSVPTPYLPSDEEGIRDHANELHKVMMGLLGSGLMRERVPAPSSGTAGEANHPSEQLSKVILAIAYSHKNPSLSITRIAQLVGCHRSKLHRSKEFTDFRAMQRDGTTLRRGRRWVGQDGKVNVDAVDDPDNENDGDGEGND